MRDWPFPEALSALRDFLSVRPTRRARQEGLPVTTTSPRSRELPAIRGLRRPIPHSRRHTEFSGTGGYNCRRLPVTGVLSWGFSNSGLRVLSANCPLLDPARCRAFQQP